jgi:hypothetical protein
LGSKLKIIESQAEAIRRIFIPLCGWTHHVEHLRSTQSRKSAIATEFRAGRQNSEWSCDAIRHILRNEKYRGQNVWKVSNQNEQPTTARITRNFSNQPTNM